MSSSVTKPSSSMHVPAAAAAAPLIVREQSPLFYLANLALSGEKYRVAEEIPGAKKRRVDVRKDIGNGPKGIRAIKPGEQNVIADYHGISYARLPRKIHVLIAKFLCPYALQGDLKAKMAEFANEKCLEARSWKKLKTKRSMAEVPKFFGVNQQTCKKIEEFLTPHSLETVLLWSRGPSSLSSFCCLMRVNRCYFAIISSQLNPENIDTFIINGKYEAMVNAWKGSVLVKVLCLNSKYTIGLHEPAAKCAPEDYKQFKRITDERDQAGQAQMADSKEAKPSRQVILRALPTPEQHDARPMERPIALKARRTRPIVIDIRNTPVRPAIWLDPLKPLEEGLYNCFHAAPIPDSPPGRPFSMKGRVLLS